MTLASPVRTRKNLFLALLFLAFIVAVGVCAPSPPPEVVRIVVDDTINPVTAEFIGRGIDTCRTTWSM